MIVFVKEKHISTDENLNSSDKNRLTNRKIITYMLSKRLNLKKNLELYPLYQFRKLNTKLKSTYLFFFNYYLFSLKLIDIYWLSKSPSGFSYLPGHDRQTNRTCQFFYGCSLVRGFFTKKNNRVNYIYSHRVTEKVIYRVFSTLRNSNLVTKLPWWWAMRLHIPIFFQTCKHEPFKSIICYMLYLFS